jgi:hypothetical protein|tara:strand:+ start:356 stop:583 length:228 start_codon:yes stop_codon:yes gene_type:complete
MNYKWNSLNTLVLGYTAGAIVLGAVSIVLLFVPFWLLWNWLMPLFGLPEVTILQSIGLYLLLRIILFQPNYTNND